MPVRSVSATANVNYNSATGEMRVASSSRRYKTDIADLQASESARMWDLRPVSFRPIDVEEGSPEMMYGFIAEEVEEVDPRLCFYGQDDEGQPRVEGVNYDMVIPLLLQEMKALKAEKTELQTLVADMKARIEVLEGKLAA